MKNLKVTDRSIERMVSDLLRAGVLISGTVVLLGGIGYLIRHGPEPVSYQLFQGAPAIDRIPSQIFQGVLALRMRSVIQLGMLLLIGTPIARVALSLAGFVLERDRAYILITAIVLIVLLYSLISGVMTG